MRSTFLPIFASACLAACAAPGTATSRAGAGPLAAALLAAGPHPARAADLGLYGRFVGHWDFRVVNHLDDGKTVAGEGEWVFGWALEGRAVQDVWIVPAGEKRDPGAAAPGPIGTTLRFPEPGRPGWRVLWANPVSGTVLLMRAREVAGEIVQEGRDEEGQAFRWIFHDIAESSFRWRAEELGPDGRWRLRQAMEVRRRPLSGPAPGRSPPP